MNRIYAAILLLATLTLFGCSPDSPTEPGAAETKPSTEPAEAVAETPAKQSKLKEREVPMAGMDQRTFGVTRDGKKVTLFQLSTGTGMVVEISNYGGVIRSLKVPDRNGVYEDIVLGYDTLAEYEDDTSFFGAVIGRFANRIAAGKFELDGTEYQLATNDGPNHLHGGVRGFGKVVWDAYPSMSREGPTLLLRYFSADGEEGYPGELRVNVRYTLTWDSRLIIEYEARTDQPTPVNLTQHSYFNLSGNARRDILGHRLEIAANEFTPVDDTLIPTGELRPVEGTPFDFRQARVIGESIDSDDEQIRLGGGYDHNWVIDSTADGQLRQVARLSDPDSGRVMTIQSTEPGLQFYSGNFLGPDNRGKGVPYSYRYGLCLETQHFPDSPNQPEFPSTILRPGEKFESTTIWSFEVEALAEPPSGGAAE